MSDNPTSEDGKFAPADDDQPWFDDREQLLYNGQYFGRDSSYNPGPDCYGYRYDGLYGPVPSTSPGAQEDQR